MARISNTTVWKMLGNLFFLISCGLPGIILELIAKPSTPFQRGFFCNDESIRYPIKANTVSTLLATILSLVIPLIGMLIIEWLLYRRYNALGTLQRDVPTYRGTKILCLKVHSYISAIISSYIPLLFAAALALSITNVIKFMIGRLRPHFLAVCQPDFMAIQCTGSDGYVTYVQDIPCSPHANSSELLDARLSFPSGHASGTASCFVYFALYLQFRMVWNAPYLLRPLVQALLLAGAMIISATRVSDYKHHWSDVFCGFFLGTVFAILVVFFVSDLYFFETPSAMSKADSSKEFVTSPSDTDLSTIVAITPNYQSANSKDFKRPTNI